MARDLGIVCSKDSILLALADDGQIIADRHEKLAVAAILEENERLTAMEAEVGRVLSEVRPDAVRILLPEQTYKDSYARIAPRAALETVVRLACVKATIPVEMLHRASARSRLDMPRSGSIESHMPAISEPIGKYWNAGRNLAAAAALAKS
jgi:hypothetical protein